MHFFPELIKEDSGHSVLLMFLKSGGAMQPGEDTDDQILRSCCKQRNWGSPVLQGKERS